MARVTNVTATDSNGANVLTNGTGDYQTGPHPTLTTTGNPVGGGPLANQSYALSSNEVPNMGQMTFIKVSGQYYRFRG